MNIQQFRYIQATLEAGSFEGAARKAFVSKGAISKSIGELEKELGVKLFQRDGRVCRPTETMNLLRETVDTIVSEIDCFVAMAKSSIPPGAADKVFVFAVAASPARCLLVDDECISAIEGLCPQREIKVLRSNSGTCLSAVEDGSIDAALVLGVVDREALASQEIGGIRPVVAMSERNELSKRDSLALADLARVDLGRPYDLRYFYPLLISRFFEQGMHPRFVNLASCESNFAFVGDDRGYVIISDEPWVRKLYPDAVFVPLDADFRVPVSLVYKKGNNDSAIAEISQWLEPRLGKAPDPDCG